MLTALDILNKNIGIIRTSTDNYFEEVHQEVLGNYFMLSLTYNLYRGLIIDFFDFILLKPTSKTGR